MRSETTNKAHHAGPRAAIALAAALAVLAACERAGLEPEALDTDASSVSAVTAVRLGAEPGCLGLAAGMTGSVSLMIVREDAEMRLVLVDGDPLCVDTLRVVRDELREAERALEASQLEGAPQERGLPLLLPGTDEGQRQDEKGGGSGSADTDGRAGPLPDPNPQPALASGVKTGSGAELAGAAKTTTGSTTTTTTTSTGTPGSAPPPGDGVTPLPRGE